MTILIDNNPKYTKYPIPEFQGNPLIEVLQPPPNDNRAALLRLMRKPTFNIEERELPSIFRMMLPARLTRFMFPTKQHVRILKRLYIQIFDGYTSRNPSTAKGQQLLHNADEIGIPRKKAAESSTNPAKTVSFITGLSGMGKSALVRAIMRTVGRPVIQHSNYNGTPFTESQILYLMRNVPNTCTPKALCKCFGENADALLGRSLYAKLFDDKSSESTFISHLNSIVKNHHVAMIVIDEIQNLSLAKSNYKNELIRLILNMRDEIGAPIVLVGTYKAADLLKTEASVARRLVDGGYHELCRPKRDDEDWRNFCEILWDFQWVKEPQLLTDEIYDVLYDCSQGITGILLNLYVLAQIESIDNEIETLDAKFLKTIYRDYFKPLHGVIDALRSENQISCQYDDLYADFTKKMKDGPLSRIQKAIDELENQEQRSLGIIDNTTENDHRCSEGTNILNASPDELWSMLQSDSSSMSEFLGPKINE